MTGRSSSLQSSTQSATGADCSHASLLQALQYLLSLHTSSARQAHDVLQAQLHAAAITGSHITEAGALVSSTVQICFAMHSSL